MATIEPNSNDASAHSRRYVDTQTDKRMHEHMSNEDDEITEQDISNIKTDFDFDNPPVSVEEPGDESGESDDEKVLDKKVEDNDDSSIDTSWNVLDA